MKLELQKLEDVYVQENMQKLQDEWNANLFTNNPWAMFDLEFSGAVANYKVKHPLGGTPLDIIETRKSGPGAVTYNYDLFDKDFLNITTTGACKIRFLAGIILTKRGK